MSGGGYDLLAVGNMDKVLTANPTSTFWRSVHKRHTPFALESQSQPFGTSCVFGQESQILLNRVGDLCYHCYLHVRLPSIVACDTNIPEQCGGLASPGQYPTASDGSSACNPCASQDEKALVDFLPADYSALSYEQKAERMREAKDAMRRERYGSARELGCCTEGDEDCPDNSCPELGDTWACYTNDIGHFLTKKCKLLIGGQEVDRLWSLYLYLWEELSGRSGRRLTELTGRRFTRSQLICDAREERELYIPLPFFWTVNTGSALPLASLAYHGVSMHIEFESLNKLIMVSGSHVAVRNGRTGLGLTPNDLIAELEVTYVYLSNEERDKFASSSFEQLIIQCQHYFKTENKAHCRIPLSFNHPCLEMLIAVRRQCQEKANNWSNLSGPFGRDPITHAELLLNTTSRFGKKPALYWRGVVPYQHHSNIPDTHCYVMSFALNPECHTLAEPSGSCNLSRIDNIELVLDMDPALADEPYTVYVFARTWNLIRYKDGVAGAAYQ